MLTQEGSLRREVALYIVQDAEKFLSCWRMNGKGICTRDGNEAESEVLGRLPNSQPLTFIHSFILLGELLDHSKAINRCRGPSAQSRIGRILSV